MAIIPRKDWEIVREQVGKVEKQVEELACLYQQKNIRQRVKEIIDEHQTRFLQYVNPLRSVIEDNRNLSELMYHDLLGYFSLINLLFQRLKTDPEEAILSMHRRTRVMRHVVDALAFYVDGEQMKAEPTYIVQWLLSFKSFFDETFKAYDALSKQPSPLASFTFPEKKDFVVSMNHSIVLLLIINLLQNALEHGKAKRVHMRLDEQVGEVTLEIMDDGKGIDTSVCAKICQTRFSTTNSFGLGLARAHERMSTMGGRIECHPRGGIGGGAKFTLFFQQI